MINSTTKFLSIIIIICFQSVLLNAQIPKVSNTLNNSGTPLVLISNCTPSAQYAGGSVIIYYINYDYTPLTVSAVSFGGIPAGSFSHDSISGKITAIVGTGASGNVSVTTNLGIMIQPNFVFLSGLPIPPTITSFTPASQIAGGTVIIKGGNFKGVSSVNFGGITGSAFTVVSDTLITAIVGASVTSGAVSVVTTAGTASINGFTLLTPNCVNIPDNNFRAFLKSKYPACFNHLNMMDTTCAGVLSETELVFMGMNIGNIEGVQYFKGLKILECSDNLLSHLPSLPDSLVVFSCVNNQLTELPKLPDGLEELQCSKNLLSGLPTLPGNLNTLYCDFNSIDSLPTLPNQLGYLNCGSNKLKKLPALPDLLSNLYCPKNQLTSLPALPGSLYGLGCAFNKLTSLPALPENLGTLHCDSNQLSSLPELPVYLHELFCGCNSNLHCLPRLPYYMALFLDSGTKIHCLPNTINYKTTQDYSQGAFTYIPSNMDLSPGSDYVSYGNTFDLNLPVCNESSNIYSCPVYPRIQNIVLCPPLINTTITSSVTGTAYQWQIDTCSDLGGVCFQNITDNGSIITGTNTATLQLSNMQVFGHKYQFKCIVDNINYKDIYRINFSDNWVGGVSTAWEDNANWSCSETPDINTDVIIDGGTITIHSPNAFCRSLTVSPNATVTIAPGARLTIAH